MARSDSRFGHDAIDHGGVRSRLERDCSSAGFDASLIVSVVNDALRDDRVGAGWDIQKTAGDVRAATMAARRT